MNTIGKGSEGCWVVCALGDDFSNGRTIFWRFQRKSGRSRGTDRDTRPVLAADLPEHWDFRFDRRTRSRHRTRQCRKDLSALRSQRPSFVWMTRFHLMIPS
jgi:hypothetical protein